MTRHWVLAASLSLGTSAALAQADFPAGLEGELYYAPRMDLVPAAEGGPLTVTLDGVLNEAVWERAAFHGWSLTADDPRNLDPNDEDNDVIWAAVADKDFLYVAWKVVDDSMVTGESSDCNVWQDDSIEVYIDAKNDGPDCTTGDASCYMEDDAQITVGADQIGKTDPDELLVGGVAGKGACDFNAMPAPEVVRGIVIELESGDIDNPFGEGLAGWQAEIAIALETLGNQDDGTPTYLIEPIHGKCIGWNFHTNDDDEDPTPGSDRDHKLIWSKKEVVETSWRNPGAFAKLQFIDPTKPLPTLCPEPVRNVTCPRNEDGSVTVTWMNPASADAAVMTDIQVDGTSVETVAGNASTVTLPETDVPEDDMDHKISVINNSGIAVDCTVIGSPLDPECSGIRFWNILGPYENGDGAAPGEDIIRTDFLTDGTTSETEFEFKAGATIASIAPLDPLPTPRNPGGVPTVFVWKDSDSRINFADAFQRALGTSAAYAQVYVIAEEEMEVFLGVSSDDSVQVFLNGNEVWINNVGRGGSSACTPTDGIAIPIPVILEEGENSLLVKVLQGIGGWEFALRFQDVDGLPISEGFEISLTPQLPPGTRFVRADTNGDGSINITDGVFVLNYLFVGGPEPRCFDSADADGGGDLNITDGVFVLNWLFIAGLTPPPPSPSTAEYAPADCGLDPPPADELGCVSFPPCNP